MGGRLSRGVVRRESGTEDRGTLGTEDRVTQGTEDRLIQESEGSVPQRTEYRGGIMEAGQSRETERGEQKISNIVLPTKTNIKLKLNIKLLIKTYRVGC